MRKTIENKINSLVSTHGEDIRAELVNVAEKCGESMTCKEVCEMLSNYVKGKRSKAKKEYTPEEKAKYAEVKKEKLDKALNLLETGVKNVFTSGKFAEYLTFMSRFHDYSFGNQVLIMMQNPEAQYVTGFKAWQKMGRHVKKGEHGISILAPNPIKYTKMVENEETGEEEEVEFRKMKYRVVTVFGDNQTEGKEMPSITAKLKGNLDDFEAIKAKLESISPVPVTIGDAHGVNGYFSPSEKCIVVQEGMSETQTVKTMVHEIAHSILHCEGGEEEEADRRTKEVQAESVAYVVLNYLGIDSSDYSFGYVAGWSADKDVKQLKASLDVISRTAKDILDAFEEKGKEVA